jgi:hypothetical protein
LWLRRSHHSPITRAVDDDIVEIKVPVEKRQQRVSYQLDADVVFPAVQRFSHFDFRMRES